MLDKLPKGCYYTYVFADIHREHFQKEGAFYLDLWPLSGVTMAVFSPTIAAATTQTNYEIATSRPDMLQRFFKPIAGGLNMFDMAEPEWRPWRTVFSKGFNNEHFVSQLPGMIEETKIYAEILRGLAKKGEMFYLDLVTLRFMMDMIGKTLLFDLPGVLNDKELMKLGILNLELRKATIPLLTA
jgi:cytochrome P450